jgi:purine-binding chemotaxis protein CheW
MGVAVVATGDSRGDGGKRGGARPGGPALGGKYLTFFLGGEEYGLEILKVQEIIGMMDITPVPGTPPFVRGVLNLRGKVIPIVDLRLKIGMEAVAQTDETCTIVVQARGVQMGTVVDKVSEVLDIANEDIEETPSFGAQVNTDYILGIGKTAGSTKLLLDIDKVLTETEAAEAGESAGIEAAADAPAEQAA